MLFHFDTYHIFDCYNYCEKVECTTPKSSNYCFPSLDWNQFHYFRKLQFPLGTTFNQKLDTLLYLQALSWRFFDFPAYLGKYTANVCRDLQGLCRGFLQYLQGKSCNIYRFSLQFLQSVNIAGEICKYYRIFPAYIAENPCRVPVNPCKHLQCTFTNN